MDSTSRASWTEPAVAASVLCLLVAYPAAAGERDQTGAEHHAAGGDELDAGRDGLYFAMGATYAFQNFSIDGDQLGTTPPVQPGRVDFGDTGGLNLVLGLRLRSHLAIELMYEWLAGFEAKSLEPEVDLGTHLLGVNTKLIALTGRIQPYGSIGFLGLMTRIKTVGDLDSPLDDASAFAVRVHAGVDFYVTRSWVFNLEGGYLFPTQDLADLQYGSLTLRALYRF